MPELRVHNVSVSIDGYAAGPDQSLEDPLGVGGERLHDWVFATRFGKTMMGESGGTTGLDDDLLRRGEEGVGATVMGRNMFGPIRGDWGESDWTGWWGPEPPYHHPVFVLTHYPRGSIEMEGGTVFHFVTDGLDAALERAFEAADGKHVRLGGGASVIRQCLKARRIDDLHLAVVPILLGGGESLFDGLGPDWGYECVELTGSEAVQHVRFRKSAQAPD